ncbi:hypothetical protein TTHERM_00187170 (macronuclear) [Tetrahymena thermophila SB210]|uniref:ODAD1 central coiled coil region domain-containing protein n=1 Tax=Tetrahymena thermophila (strain SB210) TaxID=312017 RepID=Q22T00_TETTS|nr:hypothetical protein TTHERM_00187170 [Tetrahymena thermophila SB210]EAR88638.1 hypothetical protein TTHERM_00187170 [Tetrahymena thermophila SB210]7MOQ_X Chain X, Docking complex 1 protein [Tetrahymena thermophila CU428]|eukprot:XP_001008883.1 hypothetical protein TTHERM_00187170 [Tetrahymena thermophila SB210]
MRASSATKSQKDLKTLEEEYIHQSKKSNLLENDRKIFHKNAEETKNNNMQIIESLKKENKQLKTLRDELIANKRASTPGMSKTQGSLVSWSGDIKDENYWRRKFDEARHATKNKKSQLLQLQDKLNEVSDAKFGAVEESPLMRQIRILENRLDKVMIKFNEAQSIRKTYEQIVKRLKEERVGYDNQLAAIERSLKGKEHDFEELLLLAHDATHAKELAAAELKKYEHKKAAVRELRKTYIAEKRKAIEQREAVISRMEKKDKDNDDRNLEKSQANNLNELNNPQIEPQNHQDATFQRQKLNDYDEAFRKLYEATGVTDVNEIIQKFTTQDETSKSLKDLQREYQDTIDDKKKQRDDLKAGLNALKYEGNENPNRKQLDEIEKNVNNAVNKCDKAKLKYERVSKILVDVKAGIEHLYEKLEFYKLEGKPNIVITDETLVEGLSQIVEKMKLIFQPVKNDPSYNPEDFKQTAKGVSNYINLNLRDKSGRIESISKNIRVKLPEKDEEEVSNDEIEDDIDIETTTKLKQKYQAQAKQEKAARNKQKKQLGSTQQGRKV